MKLISELIEVPDQVHGGDFVLKLTEGVQDAEGTLRDYVIGIHAVDGRGMPFKGGGRVVKNVAGYDFCKLLTGSLGTLGVITQITLKIKPLPPDAQPTAVFGGCVTKALAIATSAKWMATAPLLRTRLGVIAQPSAPAFWSSQICIRLSRSLKPPRAQRP